MNRIILIGNGFDLAHGFRTGYKDFINWYWEQWGQKLRTSSNKIETDTFCSFILRDSIGLGGWYLVWSYHYQCTLKSYDNRKLISIVVNDKDVCDFSINSILFSRICKAIDSKDWVDIEREYYELLRGAVLKSDDCNYTIQSLNSQLCYLQQLLVQYLSSITTTEPHFNERIYQQMYGKIRKNDISISHLPAYYDYISYLIQHADDEYQRLLCRYGYDVPNRHYRTIDIKRLQQYADSTSIEEIFLKDLILPENILFLNFNYTGVADIYTKSNVASLIHIHGDLRNYDSIIFGYGDEFDDDYKSMLRYYDNECLQNVKSIKYLESVNYRNLLRFIESAPYQVYIMGHSCGNSDRTLLNTLFEHKNCVSIKPYYYQKEDGSDNYIDIIQNICRNFTDMKLMRDRVVNKTFCEPLPQKQKNDIQ